MQFDTMSIPKRFDRRGIVLARATQCGPWVNDYIYTGDDRRYWLPFDTLVFYVDSKVEKGYFYLLHKDGKYRVALCRAAAWGLPPIFDGNDNLVESEIIGRFVGVADIAKKTINYVDATIPCKVD